MNLKPTPEQPIPVTMAIIYQEGKYLMQLRDNIPHILYPGVWGLFGGHLDPGERPEAGLRRELIEEISYHVRELTPFRTYRDSQYLRYLFSCPLEVSLDKLELHEGEDFNLLTADAIAKGYGYAPRTKVLKPLGDIHRQVMLDFIATQV